MIVARYRFVAGFWLWVSIANVFKKKNGRKIKEVNRFFFRFSN